MQFVYIDESGTGDEPIAVMVGVITDSYKMRLTKSHWVELLNQLSEIVGRDITEIHTRDFYAGNGPWRGLNGQQRSSIIDAIFDWLNNRQHSVVYSAVNKELFYKELHENEKLSDIGTLWRFMALHITLALQKKNQGAVRGRSRTIKPKGATVLIFDHEHREQEGYTNLFLSPPDWTDLYYDKKPRQDKMSQIVDVPHFVDSKQVELIQLADFICFFLRKHIELQQGLVLPSYIEEKEKVEKWVAQIMNRAIPKNNIFKRRGRNESEDLFYRYAPESIR